MIWWNKHSRISRWFIFILSFLCLSTGILTVWRLLEPKLSGDYCTIADCFGDGISVVFVGGEVPERYSIEISLPNGTRKLVCNKISYRQLLDTDHCTPYGGFFEQMEAKMPSDNPPKEIIVTVAVGNVTLIDTFIPNYEIWFPNGEKCTPLCYSTKIEFDLSK